MARTTTAFYLGVVAAWEKKGLSRNVLTLFDLFMKLYCIQAFMLHDVHTLIKLLFNS